MAGKVGRVPRARAIVRRAGDRRQVSRVDRESTQTRVSFDTPTLFVVYRRPEATRRVFEAIAAARPRRLFIAADGPATAADRAACEAVRSVVQRVDWECDVAYDLSDQNLGLNRRMISAI